MLRAQCSFDKKVQLSRANFILGRLLIFALSITLLGFVISINSLGTWGGLVLGFITINFMLFFITGYLATKDAKHHPKSRSTAIQLGRFYWFLTTVAPPFFIDLDYILVGIFGVAILALSYVFGRKEELLLFLVNCTGMIVWGVVTLSGISGILDSVL